MEEFDVDGIFSTIAEPYGSGGRYLLPRLLSGEALHGVEAHPASKSPVRAQGSPPVCARAASGSGDSSSSPCKSKNGSKLERLGVAALDHRRPRRLAAGAKVGEVKNLSFKKKGKSRLVMEEYRCTARGHRRRGVKVFKMHSSACSCSRQRIGVQASRTAGEACA
ncbi:hypothetical protein ZWY2020_048736 [Hordeum vulgare]|nr:hypothetical protein ZWY2020_048736 [Hordeum vulgare]